MSILFKHYVENEDGIDWAIGDIHGSFSKLEEALVYVGFDKSKDRLFSVGDLVDRGYESHLAEEYLEKPWFHAVRGNHEDMAIRWPIGTIDEYSYQANGGGWNIERDRREQLNTAEVFSSLPVVIEIEVDGKLVGITHAECPYKDWNIFKEAITGELDASELSHAYDMALWSRQRIQTKDCTKVSGIDLIVVGHTPVQTPMLLGNTYYIDTGATFGHPFFILNLNTREGFLCDD